MNTAQKDSERTDIAGGFRTAAEGSRKHGEMSPVGRQLAQATAKLAAVAVVKGFLTATQVLDNFHSLHSAGVSIDKLYDKLADLVEPQANADTTQPITRAKVAARLREISAILAPMSERSPAADPYIEEAVKLDVGAVAAGWVSDADVEAKFNAPEAHTNAGYRAVLEWLASEIENVGTVAQGDGATAPFTDISTEASKRAALANELRTVHDKLKAIDAGTDKRASISVVDQGLELEAKAVELHFVTQEEVNTIFDNAASLSRSNDSYLSALSVLANRIEQGAAQQEKVA